MAHYACIAIGMADFMPDSQEYISASTSAELAEIVADHVAAFMSDNPDSYRYEFRAPREGENNYSQRLCIARGADLALDVIGMTESEFERESVEC